MDHGDGDEGFRRLGQDFMIFGQPANDFRCLIETLTGGEMNSPQVDLKRYMGVGSSTSSANSRIAEVYHEGERGFRCMTLVRELYWQDFALLGYDPDVLC